jgi:uncharacterized protein (TIGR03083 family)
VVIDADPGTGPGAQAAGDQRGHGADGHQRDAGDGDPDRCGLWCQHDQHERGSGPPQQSPDRGGDRPLALLWRHIEFLPGPAEGRAATPIERVTTLGDVDVSTVLVEQNRLFGELFRSADPATPVPTCPGWTLRRLHRHVGHGDRWAAMIVRERATERVDTESVPNVTPPGNRDAAFGWFTDGARMLLEAVASTGADVPVWTFTGPQPAAWWVRRRLHECVVHRADAALALRAPFVVEPEVAADGVAEWLSLVAARPAGTPGSGQPALPADASLHLHATDEGLGAEGEWMVRAADGRVVWEHGHGKGSVAVRGSAADLLLALMRRIPGDDPRVQVLGDDVVWRTWLERTPF